MSTITAAPTKRETRSPAPAGPLPPAPRPATGLRPEIQALRAIAVAIVVIFHLWPAALPGGFVGVDVFFAISGFLITSLLLRELDRTGGISLTGFWVRRARRILPAALACVAACAAATAVLVPLNHWEQFFTDMRMSTVYVQNWHLSEVAVDYFAAAEAPSPVQHFWSLSVEEQFYVVWPALLLVAVRLTRRRPERVTRGAVAGVMGALTAVSLAYSIHRTQADPAAAYFVTPTRAWEFGLGGLLAALPAGSERHPAIRAALSWIGLAAIALAAAMYTKATPFPGSAALLPVLGALAVIRAGVPRPRWAPSRALASRPVQSLGDLSYSVYLWHWPLIVLAPFVVDGVSTTTQIGILMLTLILARLSKLLVEDPFRAGRRLGRSGPRWTLALAALATAMVVGSTFGGVAHVQGEVRKAEAATKATLAKRPTCFGAAARDPKDPCRNARLKRSVVPTPLEAKKLPNAPCKTEEHARNWMVCSFGATGKDVKTTVAVVGDSHAGHWRGALDVVAKANGWRGLSITRTGCPFSRATKKLVEPQRSQCVAWNRKVLAWLKRHDEVSMLFASQISGGVGVVPSQGKDRYATEIAGYQRAWKLLPSSVERVVVLRDTPQMDGSTDDCVGRAKSRRREAGLVCAEPRRTSLKRDYAAIAAQRLRSARYRAIDLSRTLCDSRRCFPVIGGALVYKDQNHLTAVFAGTLGPILRREVDGLPAL